ncbi:MAG: nitrous oxide-stimulated promoter family protein [Sporomusaceae bacterium]|nr:nitrous oxide-stimulated promoter family protein [Sporomusaceae bacterium]
MDRMDREKKSVEKLISIYCQGVHQQRSELCQECSELLHYARLRLEKCPFQAKKPVCEKCLIHCYQPEKRQQIISVMRYAGPKMIYKDPLLALQHLFGVLKCRFRSATKNLQ